MNGFQKNVNLYNGKGVPGAYAGINPIVSLVPGRIAGVDIPIGHFCWLDDDGYAVNTGTGTPIGFVVREMAYSIADYRQAAQAIVPESVNVPIATKGDFYVVASTEATFGQKVFANLSDGSIATGTAGATMTGLVETNYTVTTEGDIGDLIIISNWV